MLTPRTDSGHVRLKMWTLKFRDEQNLKLNSKVKSVTS